DAAGHVFDTTSADEARKAGIFNSRAKYGPVLVVAGKNLLLKGLDEALEGAREGEEKQVVVPKEKAFGERKADLVRLIPLARFREQGIEPAPGMPFELDGARARVQSVTGGRVRVDFNHELAGQDLSYSLKVVKCFKTPQEKIVALAKETMGVKDASVKDGVATVKVGVDLKKDSEFLAGKLRFIDYALRFVDGVNQVVFNEAYALPEKRV
ncbi:MAG: FKBP-type peptidyl-prolyl cis-trans isomerase, partial [Candidatus Norongarragalinales archaeon]